jgi:hypothetical protein
MQYIFIETKTKTIFKNINVIFILTQNLAPAFEAPSMEGASNAAQQT